MLTPVGAPAFFSSCAFSPQPARPIQITTPTIQRISVFICVIEVRSVVGLSRESRQAALP